MKHCETCMYAEGCFLTLKEIRNGECDRIYKLADKERLLKRYKDPNYWPNKELLKDVLDT